MLNKSFFKQLKKDFERYVGYRRVIIKNSGDALHKSKRAIFALHRDDLAGAEKLLKEAEEIFGYLDKKIKERGILNGEGSYKAALEEYVEARLFYNLLTKEEVDKIKKLSVPFDSYLGGLCDLTGEILRRAVNQVSRGNYGEAEKAKEVIEEIMGELIEMNLTGYLRVKYDGAKRSLKKIEEILYDVKIRGAR